MKKVLKVLSIAFAAFLLFAGVANAQGTYDTLSVRNMRYTTLQYSGAPIVHTESLKSDSASVLADVREGRLAVGYKINLTADLNTYTVDVREPISYDGYLYILDSNFDVVASNDDNYMNGVSGSTCTGVCGVGTYYIILTHYSSSVPSGNAVFNLTVDVRPITCTIKGINAFSELSFRPVSDTADLVEMTDSIVYNDTLYIVDDMYFLVGGEALIHTDGVSGDIYPLAGYTFTLDSSRLFSLDVFDTIDTIGYWEIYLLDDQYRLLPENGIRKLEAGTYNLVFVIYDVKWGLKLPLRYSLAFHFDDALVPQSLAYTTISALPYADTVSCTPSSRLVAINYGNGYTETSRLTSAYKMHMNVDTLYSFRSVDIDTASDYHYMMLLDSNFKVVQEAWSEYGLVALDFMPTKSEDYYIVILNEGVEDTSDFTFSASKSAMPAFYVDAVNGDDENDGTTPSTAFASFDKVLDSTGVVYLMSDIDFNKNLSISGVINLKGYQNRAYTLNGNGNGFDVDAPQFVVGSENAQDTLIFVDSWIRDVYGGMLDIYGDVEFTATTPAHQNCISSLVSLNVHGTRFHDIYLADYSLIRSGTMACNINGISADNCTSDEDLMNIYFMNDKCVIDSCSFTNCSAKSILYLYTDRMPSVESPVFEVSNVAMTGDSIRHGALYVPYGGCVVNMTNVNIEHNDVIGGGSAVILNGEGSLFNMHSGNISHNVLETSAIANLSYGRFVMYGGTIEDNICKEMVPVVNYGGIMELRGGRMNDNVTINVSGGLPELHGVTMRNYGGILSVEESKLTIRDSFSINTDAFIMTDTAVTIGSALTANECGTLLPIRYQSGPVKSTPFLSLEYYEGRQMLDGDSVLVRSQYSKFGLAQYDTITWYIDNRGKLTSTPVGLNTAEQVAVKVYPNPTSDFLHIDAGTLVAEGVILDMQGRVVARQPIVSGSAKINMQNMANGVYFIQLSNDSHEVLATRKIIKK